MPTSPSPSSSGRSRHSSGRSGGRSGLRADGRRRPLTRSGRWRFRRGASGTGASIAGEMAVAVRELPLDLDAFEGPFDLLLTLVLREEFELADVDVAEIVLAFLERLEERGALDLDACGEFLVLVAALLELKARSLFPGEELDLDDLDPEEAASELAERLFRTGPAPLAPVPARTLAPQDPQGLVVALRALAAEPREPSLGHLVLSYPPVSRPLEPITVWNATSAS